MGGEQGLTDGLQCVHLWSCFLFAFAINCLIKTKMPNGSDDHSIVKESNYDRISKDPHRESPVMKH